GPPRRAWAGRRGEGLAPREEPEEEREYDGDDKGRAQGEVEAPASSLDVDIAGQPSEPWHLSGELTRQQEETSQNYHHDPETEKQFAQASHRAAARTEAAAGRWERTEWRGGDASPRAASPSGRSACAPRIRS